PDCLRVVRNHYAFAMRKRRIYVIMIAVGIFVGALVLVLIPSREREPSYGGKRLSEWVDSYGTERRDLPYPSAVPHQDADVAIDHIGSAAVPYLLKWMVYETTAGQKRFYQGVKPMLGKLKHTWHLNETKACM